jgi:hypothetical protein
MVGQARVVVLLVAVAFAATAAAEKPHAGRSAQIRSCPTQPLTHGDGDEAVSAARRALSHTLRLKNQLGVVHFTRANAHLLAVAPLIPLMHPIPGAATWRREAMSACGAKVADRSWVVEFDFITAPAVGAGEGVMFLTKTTSGWRVWRHRFA